MKKEAFDVFCPTCNILVEAKVIARGFGNYRSDAVSPIDEVDCEYHGDHYSVAVCRRCNDPFLIRESVVGVPGEFETVTDETVLYPAAGGPKIESLPDSKTMNRREIKLAAESMQNLMVAIGRGGNRNDSSYFELRDKLLSFPEIKTHLPDFVITCRNGLQFWAMIGTKFAHYRERDQFIWSGFEPLFCFLETEPDIPAADVIGHTLQTFDKDHVYSAWQKSVARLSTDPEAALTSARTLIESTCKHILDGLRVSYQDSADLPDLYSSVAKNLNLSPNQHAKQVFKQILGGCHSVVQGIGALRNKMSDAHGKGSTSYRPAPRHSALAVNLAGAMAVFLVETYEAHKSKIGQSFVKPEHSIST